MFYDGKNYNEKADLQKIIAQKLVEFASEDILKANNIIDIGCGTGFVGKEALKVSPRLILHGIDKSLDFIRIAEKFYNKVFLTEFEIFKPEMHYDIALSSMCLQWFEDINLAISKLSKISNKFYFAIPEEDSLKEITNCFTKFGFQSPILYFQNPLNLKPFYTEIFEQDFKSLLLAVKSFNAIGIKNPNYTETLSHSKIKLISKDFVGRISWKISFYKSS